MYPLHTTVRRGVVAAFLGLSVLAPAAAHALPSGPGDGCLPPAVPVTGADAELLGTLRQTSAAEVGLATQFTMQPFGVRIPSPECDGEYLSVPQPPFRWDVLSRPAGSVGQPAPTTSLTVQLVPDVAGSWVVGFTACPSGCRVTGASVTIPPLQQTVAFAATAGVERHLSTGEFGNLLFGALAATGARIQVSHTGAGSNINGTPYDVAFYPLTQLFQKRCLDVPDPPKDCDRIEEAMTTHVTFHTITPSLSSFIDFGPQKLDDGSIKDIFVPIPVEPVEVDVPTWLRAVILSLQHLSNLVGAIDIDRVRGLANDINLEFNRGSAWAGTIDNGAITLQLHFDSEHPTIKCEGHFMKKVGFIFTVDSGWADDLCPDFDLSQMDMTIRLYPALQDGALTIQNADVEVHLTPADAQSELIDAVRDLSSRYETKISEKVHDRLLDQDNRKKLGSVLTRLLKNKYPDIGTLRSSQITASDWVIRYDPK